MQVELSLVKRGVVCCRIFLQKIHFSIFKTYCSIKWFLVNHNSIPLKVMAQTRFAPIVHLTDTNVGRALFIRTFYR